MSDIEHKVDLEAGTLIITVPLERVHRIERERQRSPVTTAKGYAAFSSSDREDGYKMVIESGRLKGEVYDMTIDTDKATFDALNEWWCGRVGGPQ